MDRMSKEVVEYPIPNRLYRHYKGGLYQFMFMSTHSETGEPLVIYRSVLFGSHYARPLEMWFEEIPGYGKRFEICEEEK